MFHGGYDYMFVFLNITLKVLNSNIVMISEDIMNATSVK